MVVLTRTNSFLWTRQAVLDHVISGPLLFRTPKLGTTRRRLGNGAGACPYLGQRWEREEIIIGYHHHLFQSVFNRAWWILPSPLTPRWNSNSWEICSRLEKGSQDLEGYDYGLYPLVLVLGRCISDETLFAWSFRQLRREKQRGPLNSTVFCDVSIALFITHSQNSRKKLYTGSDPCLLPLFFEAPEEDTTKTNNVLHVVLWKPKKVFTYHLIESISWKRKKLTHGPAFFLFLKIISFSNSPRFRLGGYFQTKGFGL